jgi:hypothetical protein
VGAGFTDSHGAGSGQIAFAMGFVPLAVLITALPAAAVSIAIAGGWLLLSPRALGFAAQGLVAWSADLLAGLALIALGTLALRGARARGARAGGGRAGRGGNRGRRRPGDHARHALQVAPRRRYRVAAAALVATTLAVTLLVAR